MEQKYDLSILIPARNEEFLAKTIEDIFKHSEAKTEVIAMLDGYWPKPGLPDDPRLTVIHFTDSIGQREGTNMACRVSNAKYIMKVDAHCHFDQGFDRKMLEAFKESGDNVIMVPIMKNLHAFDWICKKCGNRWYQGPTPTSCKKQEGEYAVVNPACNSMEFEREMVWLPNKRRPNNASYCFDSTPHFQYFREYGRKQEGYLVETMSLQGSCFMCTRDKYWELDLGGSAWPSWGSQGIQLACSIWLSGGRVLCNKNTWYAHMFRTQGGDFGFPYSQSGRKIDHAKAYAKKLIWENGWPKQIYPSSWLLEKFWPVPGWMPQQVAELKKVPFKPYGPSKGIIYYTDNRLKLSIAKKVQNQLLHLSKKLDIPIVSASLKPMPQMGKNIYLPLKRGYLTMFKQILAALEASDADIIYFCEHDVLYPPEHFDFVPQKKDTFYYDLNWWKIRNDGFAIRWKAQQVSGICVYRDTAIEYYRKRIAAFDPDNFDRKFEPMSEDGAENWEASVPHVDIRHDSNLTYNKWGIEHFRKKETAKDLQTATIDKIPGWNITAKEIYGE